MYNVAPDVTMLQLNMTSWVTNQLTKTMKKETMLPRLMWVHTGDDMKTLHFEVFKHIRFVFSEWADWTHPESQREPKPEQ